MANTKWTFKMLILVCVAEIVAGCARHVSPVDTATGRPSTPAAPASSTSFKNYPDQTFDVKGYTKGMAKGGHNLLIWQDPAINLSQYASVKLTEFGGRLLPAQNAFSYDP